MSKKATLHVQHTFAIKTKTERINCPVHKFGIQRNRVRKKRESRLQASEAQRERQRQTASLLTL